MNETDAEGAPATDMVWLGRLHRALSSSGMLPALVLVLLAGTILSPVFMTEMNITNVLRIGSVLGLLAIGQTFVILAGGGGIDLSVASVAAASAIVGAQFQEMGLIAVIFMSLAAGTFFGIVNGLGTTTAGLQPFIVTLATFTIARGVGFQLTQAQPIYLSTEGLEFFSRGNVGPVPVPIVVFVGALVVGQLALTFTTFGRSLYAVGGNEEAAYASGINVRGYRMGVFVISGLLAGVAGVLGMAQLNTADPNFGNGLELASIAAVVVGGATLAGGRGTIIGTGVGVAIMALIANLLNLMNVNPWTQQIVTGLIIIVVVASNRAGDARTENQRVWNGLPLYASLLVGAFILYFVLQ